MQTPFLRTAFNYDRNKASDESGLDCSIEPSRTQQHFKDEVNINTIVRRFGLTGKLPEGVRKPTYEDFSNVHDFQSAMNAIALANEAFDAMPAHVRKRFDHDPQLFLEFVNKEDNRAEAEKLGLVQPKRPPVPSDKGAGPTGATGPGGPPTGGSEPPKPPASDQPK